jgi:hypothetical protein
METQKLFFQQIKAALPSHLSLVDEVAELLKISYDSAYRRIRSEKILSLDELQILSNRFSISLDTLLSLKNNNVVFRDFMIGPDGIGIKDWLKVILLDMQRIHAAKEKVIMYSAKDPPLFHYFQVPEIGAFKTFFWQKTLLQFPEFEDKKFSLAAVDNEIQELGMQCLAKYVRVPTIELWNVDTFIIAFSQMEYYYVSGLFENNEDIFTLCDKFDSWLRHIQRQAELGFKFIYGMDPVGAEENFKLYLNEVVLNDNSIYVKMDDQCVTYITDNVLSLLITTNPVFCSHKKKFLDGLCQKSSLISHVNAKERGRFFNRLLHRIEEFKETIR